MKKVFILMMCCIAMAFASCKPEQEPANQKFIGTYEGDIYINGTANSPQFADIMPEGIPLDSMGFHLTADITAGEKDDIVNVLFAIVDGDETHSYNTTGSVNGNNIDFGDLSYTYVEGPNTLTVVLTLMGVLNNDVIVLNGPATGNGKVVLEGFSMSYDPTLDLTITGEVDGKIVRK